MTKIQRICVFCGSSPGAKPDYLRAAKALGEELARLDLGLVYGGASVGMMGEVARTVLNAGGRVTGVIPEALRKKEVAFDDLQDLRVVGSMHERKALMADLADGFIALPGGLGTLEEYVEVVTWAQLGIHAKPCGLLNVCGYYDPLLAMIERMSDQQFVNPVHRQLILEDETAQGLLKQFYTYRPPVLDKAEWILKLNGRTPKAA